MNIPENFDDSDDESESLSDKLRRIGVYTGNDHGSPQQTDKTDNHQVWVVDLEMNKQTNQGETSFPVEMHTDTKVEKEMVINSQESVITDDGNNKAMMVVNNPEATEQHVSNVEENKNLEAPPDRKKKRKAEEGCASYHYGEE